MLTADRYLTASTLDEALRTLVAEPGARIVAGATDILPWAREGRAGDVHIPTLVDVSCIPDLDGVRRQDGRITIGANTVIGAFLRDPLLLEAAPVLRHVAVWFADDQIREQATAGGNLVNASPAADAVPPLVAMAAAVELAGPDGRRTLPLSEFLLGPGKTALRREEILVSISFDDMNGYGSAFRKVGHRRSLVISTVCVAALVKRGSDGRFADVRIGLGAVGPIPERLVESERMLIGQRPDPEAIRAAAEPAIARVLSRTRRAYRREVVVNFVAGAIADALVECDRREAAHV